MRLIFAAFAAFVLAAAAQAGDHHPRMSDRICGMRTAILELNAAARALAEESHESVAASYLAALERHRASIPDPGKADGIVGTTRDFAAVHLALARLIEENNIAQALRVLGREEVRAILQVTTAQAEAADCAHGWQEASAVARAGSGAAVLEPKREGQARGGMFRSSPGVRPDITAFFAFVIVAGAVGGIALLRRERRVELRKPCCVESFVVTPGAIRAARIRDISGGGAKIEARLLPVEKGDLLELGVAGGTWRSRIAWRNTCYAGLQFEQRLPDTLVEQTMRANMLPRPDTPGQTDSEARPVWWRPSTVDAFAELVQRALRRR